MRRVVEQVRAIVVAAAVLLAGATTAQAKPVVLKGPIAWHHRAEAKAVGLPRWASSTDLREAELIVWDRIVSRIGYQGRSVRCYRGKRRTAGRYGCRIIGRGHTWVPPRFRVMVVVIGPRGGSRIVLRST